jgi:hypothetical protein
VPDSPNPGRFGPCSLSRKKLFPAGFEGSRPVLPAPACSCLPSLSRARSFSFQLSCRIDECLMKQAQLQQYGASVLVYYRSPYRQGISSTLPSHELTTCFNNCVRSMIAAHLIHATAWENTNSQAYSTNTAHHTSMSHSGHWETSAMRQQGLNSAVGSTRKIGLLTSKPAITCLSRCQVLR